MSVAKTGRAMNFITRNNVPKSFIITLLILCMTTSITSIVNNKNENLEVDYYEMDDPEAVSMESQKQQLFPWRQINFISPSQELAQTRWWYEAPLSFSARGMDHLYLLNSYLMEFLLPSGLPEEIVNDRLFTDPIPLVKENRAKMLSHFWGMILAATIGLCLAVVVPLFGFLVCCCWCNGDSKSRSSRTRAKSRESPAYANAAASSRVRSKSRSKQRKRYHVETGCDSCCRSFFGIFHFLLLLLVSFFVICAFVTNEYVRNGLHEMPKTLNQSLDDVQLYLNNTQFEVNTLLRTNYGQLEAELFDSLDKSGIIVKNRLALVSQAVALDNLTEIVAKLDTIQTDLRILMQETNELRNSLHLLSTGLHRAKKDLEKVFKDCSHPVCTGLRTKYRFVMEKFKVSAKLDSLPDLSPLMSNISALLQSDIVHEVQRGKESFDRISVKIQSAVNDSIPDIKQQIRAVGEDLSVTAREINEVLRIPSSDIKQGKEAVAVGGYYIEQYEQYRWYACLAASGIILAILACYTLGLLNGVCGNQPTVNEYRNRRQKPPSTWMLSLGIFLLFFFFGFLMLATIGLFFVGSISDRVGCYYLEHPSEASTRNLVSLIQKHIEQLQSADSMRIINENHGIKPNVADVLTRCHLNQSLYNALQLQKFNKIQVTDKKVIDGFNISSILQFKNRYRIEERLNAFLAQVDVSPGPIVILTKEANALLDALRDTSLGTLNFSSFAELINQRVTPLDLIAVANELENEANLLPPSQIEHSTNLKNIAIILESYQLKVITKVHHSVERLRSNADKIELKAQYGSRGMKDALTDLLQQAKNAQAFIEQRGKVEIKNVAKGFVSDLSSLIDQYSRHVVKEVETSVGRCEPVSRAVNASIMSVCKEVVLPFNGYWLSMSSALVICLPATLCAYILSKLYPKLKRNPNRRHATDSDFGLDNLDEDDIPLAHVNNKNDSSHNPYAAESRRAGPSGFYSAGHSSHSASASAPVAEDNWSPGAPPLYTRPPPYFNS